VICGKTEKSAVNLERAHIKAHSKGGTEVVPMCPTCHTKFDSGKMTQTELKKIKLDMKTYQKLLPKNPGKKKDDWWF